MNTRRVVTEFCDPLDSPTTLLPLRRCGIDVQTNNGKISPNHASTISTTPTHLVPFPKQSCLQAGIAYHHLGWTDMGTPRMDLVMRVLGAIHASVAAGGVLVHCHAGTSVWW